MAQHHNTTDTRGTDRPHTHECDEDQPATRAATSDQDGPDRAGGQSGQNGRSTDIHDSPLMAHLLDALEAGTDIGHYGRLTFTMIARFFLPDEEIVKLLEKQPGMNETQAKALLLEVQAHDYNPPRRNQILQWQQRQDFPLCPNADDPRSCNVYDELRFPDSVYEHIQQFYEQQVEAHEHEQSDDHAEERHGGHATSA